MPSYQVALHYPKPAARPKKPGEATDFSQMRTGSFCGGITAKLSSPILLALEVTMDERIELFLADVLALEGETPETIRQGVRTALTDCETIYRSQKANRRMKEKAVQASHSLCRARRRSRREAFPPQCVSRG